MITHYNFFICPLDGNELTLNNKSLCCTQGHQFDIARQGYVNLLPVQNKRSKSPGDTKEMVQARRDFLSTNTYGAISEHLNQLILSLLTDQIAPIILDAGCGEGYYLANLANTFKQKEKNAIFFGLDIAKEAILAAAKSDKTSQYMVASNRSIPLKNNSVHLLTCLFGFPCFEEFSKKLTNNGMLILVESGENHLIELRKLIYPEIKPYQQNAYPDATQAGFTWHSNSQVSYQASLNKETLANLLLMTPHIHRANATKKTELKQLDGLDITIDVNFRVLLKNEINECNSANI